MNVSPYIKIARPSHWLKNVFVMPGFLLALYFEPSILTPKTVVLTLFALVSVCLVASSNYVLNELLDAERDRHHPDKQSRPLVTGEAQRSVAYALWAVLTVIGLATGYAVDARVGHAALLLWIMAAFYNVPPVRMKDQPYVDVLCESVNNPIRMAIGWFATGLSAAPPLSVLVAYWMFGAFLMAAKRLAEYRHIITECNPADYRSSFRYYTEERLIESIMFYAALFAMMSGIFITRYRIELVLATPVVAFAMAYYMHVGFKPNSPVQHPEELVHHPKLMLVVAVAFSICTALLFVDLPAFGDLFQPWILPHH
ncbi:MAG: UbiA prenyltransferase family protein [Verrucomicrobia bacterium]|nr:UbiA prenyltransferase family protein [Verrucomicrobiota bacterium]MDA1085701.1 UbiA prenyltransferase family protein [Verrucomicrobiota bacterium]